MKLKQLFEAPISMHHVEINDEGWRPSSFRSDDQKIIASKKARVKISKIFHASVCDINLILLDVKDRPTEAVTNALYGTADYYQWVRDQVSDKFTNTAINVIFTNNEGADRVPLTGWMIAHRIFHALVPFLNTKVPEHNTMKRIENQRKGVIFDLSNAYNLDINPVYIAAAMGSSRACRMQKLTAFSEIVAEAFAQYLLTGEVKFRELPPVIEVGYQKYPCIQGNLSACNHMVKSFEKFLNENFPILIRESIGKVFQL